MRLLLWLVLVVLFTAPVKKARDVRDQKKAVVINQQQERVCSCS